MKLMDLYYRIVETTGLEVVTLGSLRSAIQNCLADLTSRGYKVFKELHKEDIVSFKTNLNLIEIDLTKGYIDPETNLHKKFDIRKIIYLRLFFPTGAVVATRYSLSNKRVSCTYLNNAFRSMIEPKQAIFYLKGDKLYIEWHTSCGETIENICFGYYQKLSMPDNFPEDSDNLDKLYEVELDIREEFEDALVFYAAYFYYSRFIKDTDKIQLYLSQYKYYVEDITHELAYEDEFNEEDAVIKCVED